MQLIEEPQFVQAVTSLGFEFDPAYGTVVYPKGVGDERFWTMPERPACWAFMLHTILAEIEPWQHCWVWKRGSSWLINGDGERVLDDVSDKLLGVMTLPSNFGGAIRFDRAESVSIVTAAFVKLCFGFCVWDDLFIIPDHGRQLVQTSHHDVVHVGFRDVKLLVEFVNRMEKADFPLPNEVPDGTFKTPSWMRS